MAFIDLWVLLAILIPGVILQGTTKPPIQGEVSSTTLAATTSEELSLPIPCVSGLFECDAERTECVPYHWRCDNETDCTNTDEDEKGCANSTCPTPSYFRCNSGQCIPENWVCDGEGDCIENEDEQNCPPKCNEDFACANGRCILKTFVCDRDNDCLDWSDELNCNYTTEVDPCRQGSWPCGDGRCIDIRFVCDGDPDCLRMQDEQDCNTTVCEVGDFSCDKSSRKRCIPKEWVCDGDKDCSDGKDELNCELRPCSQSSDFRCDTNRCIDDRWVCDHETDCLDKTDEANCTEASSYIFSLKSNVCRPSEFSCRNISGCLSRMKICNGVHDCPEGEDEQICDCGVRINLEDYISIWYNRQQKALDTSSENGGVLESTRDESRDSLSGPWPWMAAIFTQNGFRYLCGGVLVDPRHVLTTAGCFGPASKRHSENEYIVFLGDKYRQKSSMFEIEAIRIHRDYDEASGRNDVALIRLVQSQNMLSHLFPSICLPDDLDESEQQRSNVTLIAWLSPQPDAPHELMEFSGLDLSPDSECNLLSWKSRLYSLKAFSSEYLCLDVSQEDRIPSDCHELVGSPLMTFINERWVLLGIKTTEWDCIQTNVYLNIHYYNQWIRKSVNHKTSNFRNF